MYTWLPLTGWACPILPEEDLNSKQWRQNSERLHPKLGVSSLLALMVKAKLHSSNEYELPFGATSSAIHDISDEQTQAVFHLIVSLVQIWYCTHNVKQLISERLSRYQ